MRRRARSARARGRRRRRRSRSHARARRAARYLPAGVATSMPLRQPLREQLVHHLVAEGQVRDRRGDVRVREEADLALDEAVEVHVDPARLAERGLAAEGEEPAGVVRALHDDIRGVGRQHALELGRRVDGLVGGDPHLDGASYAGEPLHVPVRHGLLDPVEAVLGETPDPLDGGVGVPRLVRVDAQRLLGADRLAHGRDHGIVVARASDLEVDHLVVCEAARAGRECGRFVALREAEEVELLVDAAAEERVGGAAERPSQSVPARRLDPREDELRELRRRLPAAARPDLVEDRLDLVHATADDLARERPAELGSRERHLADRLAPPDDAVLGMDGEQDEVGADLRAARPVELLRERDARRAPPRRA